MFKRVMIKLSGEVLGGDSGHFNDETVKEIIEAIQKIRSQGIQVILVVGGGNFFRGVQKDPSKKQDTAIPLRRTKADQIGMLGTVMNGIFLSEALRLSTHAVPSIVMTPFQLHDFTEVFSIERAEMHLNRGDVVILAAGVGLPYFSTDTVTVLRGVQLEADCILFAKNIDGIYDRHPALPGARRYKTLSYQTILEKGLDAIDLSAMAMARAAGAVCFIYELREPDNIYTACLDNEETYKIGTKVAEGIEEVFYE